jgi:hypothetical protein
MKIFYKHKSRDSFSLKQETINLDDVFYKTSVQYSYCTSRILLNNVTCSKFEQIYFLSTFGWINILTFASQLGFRIYSVVNMWLYCVYFSKLQRFSKISTNVFGEKSRKIPTCVVLGCKTIQFRNCGKSFHRFVKYKTPLIHMWRGKNCLLRGRWFFKANYKKIIATLHPAFKAAIFLWLIIKPIHIIIIII